MLPYITVILGMLLIYSYVQRSKLRKLVVKLDYENARALVQTQYFENRVKTLNRIVTEHINKSHVEKETQQ